MKNILKTILFGASCVVLACYVPIVFYMIGVAYRQLNPAGIWVILPIVALVVALLTRDKKE